MSTLSRGTKSKGIPFRWFRSPFSLVSLSAAVQKSKGIRSSVPLIPFPGLPGKPLSWAPPFFEVRKIRNFSKCLPTQGEGKNIFKFLAELSDSKQVFRNLASSLFRGTKISSLFRGTKISSLSRGTKSQNFSKCRPLLEVRKFGNSSKSSLPRLPSLLQNFF